MDRRDFIKKTGWMGVGLFGLQLLDHSTLLAKPPLSPSAGFGPLIPDPNKILHLPKGFSYKIISTQGEEMTDGFLTPGKADGMAAFKGTKPDEVILIRNHEVSAGDSKNGPFGADNRLMSKIPADKIYDSGRSRRPGLGGTTTLIYNESTGEVTASFLSLTGTIRNCAGGPTPWNSWLTCEENVNRADDDLEVDHGYIFDVPASATGLIDPIPLRDMGRFNHEAAAVDPETGMVYLTEDRGDGLFYRFIPHQPGRLEKGGTLEAMVIKNPDYQDTRNWNANQQMPLAKPFSVEWVSITDVESPNDDLRYQGAKKGAAIFARGEGMWRSEEGILYFACTSGGIKQRGQIFKYTPSTETIELFVEPNNVDVLKNADNLTVAPFGDLMVCEDDDHPFILGVTPKGEIYQFAENVGYESELAGVCYSPSGNTLFVNIQHAGLTLAITGPWNG